MRRAPPAILACLFGLVAVAGAETAQPSPRKESAAVIPVLTPWLNAEGRPGPAAWRHAAHFTIPYEIDPGRNAPAPVSTRVDIGYTPKMLWLRFVANDPHPDNVRVRYREHDNISSSSEDYVGLFFSPFNDTHWAYEFFCTAGGVEADLFRQQNHEYSSYDTVWACSGKQTSKGYVVVMKIPFGSIKFPHSDQPQTWRIMLFRNWPRNLRHQLADQPLDYNSNCILCQMQIVQTATPVTASPANFQLIPAVTVARTDVHNDATGGLDRGSPKVEGSLDARWILQPNLEWAATLNPNFSQVAPDVLQLSVNNQFPLFYPENRPFFRQGTQVFNTPGLLQSADTFGPSGELVDTRAIADPNWATKLVGQVGANAIGVLLANDSTTNIVLPGPENSSIQSFDFGSRDALFRYRYDVGNSALGVLATGRAGGDYSNGVYAFDAHWQLDPSDTVTALVGASSTTYSKTVADAFGISPGSIAGQTWTAEFSRNRRSYNFSVSATHVGTDFRADLGYLPQVGYDEGALNGEYDFYGPDTSWFQNGGFGGLSKWTRTAGGGPVLDRKVTLYAFEHGHYQTHFIFFASRENQYYQGKFFSLRQYQFNASAQPTAWLNGEIDTVWGDGVDYVGAREGGLLSISTSLAFAPGRHLQISLVNEFERLNVEGGRLYTANLYDLRIAWYFTSHLFLRVIGQEQDVRNNTALYPPGTSSRTRDLATQWLIGYQLNPWTAFFAGIDNEYLGVDQGGMTPQHRKYFVKASYYFQP